MQINWPKPTETPTLSAGDVHVWAVPLDEAGPPARELAATLSGEERGRAERFVRGEPRHDFVTTRAAVRSILGQYLAVPPAEVPIVSGSNGKPLLGRETSGSGLCFNIAHSAGLALVAVARGGEIGVDVERVRAVEDTGQLAARNFHPAELAALRAAAAPELSLLFLRCWTRKEAVLKAIGIGIGFPLQEFCVPSGREVREWVALPAHETMAATRCWLQEVEPCAEYVAAVATLDQSSPPCGLLFRR